jgi:ammonia channel protein AmtB
MAEINIERKQRSAMPWLLLGALLLALLWFLFARGADNGLASGPADSAFADTSAAAGTLAPPDGAGSGAGTTGDTSRLSPPR